MSVSSSAPGLGRWRQAWGIASDLLIVTALIWTLPLLLGGVVALVKLLVGSE